MKKSSAARTTTPPSKCAGVTTKRSAIPRCVSATGGTVPLQFGRPHSQRSSETRPMSGDSRLGGRAARPTRPERAIGRPARSIPSRLQDAGTASGASAMLSSGDRKVIADALDGSAGTAPTRACCGRTFRRVAWRETRTSTTRCRCLRHHWPSLPPTIVLRAGSPRHCAWERVLRAVGFSHLSNAIPGFRRSRDAEVVARSDGATA
jgi:hypothetical protein